MAIPNAFATLRLWQQSDFKEQDATLKNVSMIYLILCFLALNSIGKMFETKNVNMLIFQRMCMVIHVDDTLLMTI